MIPTNTPGRVAFWQTARQRRVEEPQRGGVKELAQVGAFLAGPYIHAAFYGGMNLSENGSEEQKQALLPRIAKGELLLQKRAPEKRLWGGYWSNSCCSHPRRGETLEIAASRRLRDELNFDTELEHVYWFCYEARFGPTGSENELCHVYLGYSSAELHPNDNEIAEVRYVSPVRLEREFEEHPERFTPWFKQEWRELVSSHRERLARYCKLS